MTRYWTTIATIGVTLGCLWPAGAAAAQELPVQSIVVRPNAPVAHRQAAAPARVEIPFRTVDPAALRAARARAHQQYLHSRQPFAASGRQSPLAPQSSIFGGFSWSGLAAVPVSVPGSSTDLTPPDGGGGIGPNAFIEAVNSEIAVYDRTTTALIAHSTLATFFGNGATEPCDPYVMWDNGAQRWVVTSIECTNTGSHTLYLAFTKSADPTDLSAGWCTYAIDSGTEFPDYPKTGHNNSDWLVGTNDYSTTTGAFDTSQLWAFPKPPNGTITGTCPTVNVDKTSTASTLTTVDGHSIFTPDASDQLDSGAPPPPGSASDTGYFVAYELPLTNATSASQIDVIDFSRDATGTAHFTAVGDIPVTSYAVPGAVPQPGAALGDSIDPSDTRGLGATSHVDPTRCSGCEAVWIEHAINGPGGRSEIQWDEVNPAACAGADPCGSGALLQDGLLSSPSLFYWNPRISPDGFGNEAVMNFNAGSATQLPEIMAVSNTPADAPGTTRDPIVVQTSSQPDDDFSCPSRDPQSSSCRWGDYPAAEADPLNPRIVWNSSMYTASAADSNHDAQWGTQNFAVRAAGPAANVSVSLSAPSVPATGTAQTIATATVADAGGAPVQGDAVTFSSSDGGDQIGPVTDHHDGIYTATITGSTTVGTPTITATDSSPAPAVSGQALLTQTPGPAASVAVTLSPSSIVANGTSHSAATATVTDVVGHPVAGERVSFASTDSGDHVGAVSDNHDGTYTATITGSTAAGAPTITVTDSSVSPPLAGYATLTQVASTPPPLPPAPLVITNLTESNHKFRVGRAQATLVSRGPSSDRRVALSTSWVAGLAHLLDIELAALAGRPTRPPVASAARKPPVGTVFSFTLNAAAQVQLVFAQRLPGRKVRGKCMAQKNRNRNRAKCSRSVFRGSLSLSAHAGIDRVRFAGVVPRAKKLGPGNYTMTITASTSTGRSAPRTISFTIVR